MIEKIELQNIRLFEGNQPRVFTFDKGIIVITGSNGSGKSTVLNSIQWVIADTLEIPLRYFRSSGCPDSYPSFVSLWVEGLYIKKSISWGKKDYSTQLEITQDGNIMTFPNVTGGKNYILQSLGLQPYLFNNGVFLAQQTDVALLTRPSTARDFLFKLFDVDKYENLNKKTKENIAEIETSARYLEGKIQSIKERLKGYGGLEDIESLKVRLDFLESTQQEWKQSLVSVNLPHLLKVHAERKLLYETIGTVKKKIRGLSERDKDKISKDLEVVSSMESIIMDNLNEIQSNLNYLKSLIDILEEGKCPTCSQDLNKEDVEKIKNRSYKSIDLYKRDKTQLQNYSPILKQMRNSLSSELQQAVIMESQKNSLREMESRYLSMEDVSSKIAWCSDLQNSSNQLVQKIEELKYNLKRMDEYDTERENMEVAERDIVELLERKEVLCVLRDAYGRDGIPNYIIESQLDTLKHSINENLQILSDGDMEIEFVLFSNGRETFEIVVKQGIFKKPLFSLSGGETQRVLLSCAFGLADFIKCPVKWRIGDEIDSSLDEEGILALKRLLTNKRDKYEQIILATHRDTMKDIADNVIDLG